MADAEILATLSLGGNVGDVAASFRHAHQRLAHAPQVELVAQSSVWRTKAWGKTDQADFLNMAVMVRTSLQPRDLLALCLAIEKERGRERGERWGPRTLDIDILTYGSVRIDEVGLTVPHPRLGERAFVLAPLGEIAPDLEIDERPVSERLTHVNLDGVAIDVAATAAMLA